jgi:hypothetical protein
MSPAPLAIRLPITEPLKTRRSCGITSIICVGTFVYGTPALADSGTPLMWATMFHLAILNLVIGVIEGSLIARIFKRPAVKTNALTIVANYFSAFAGAFSIVTLWHGVQTLLPAARRSIRPAQRC